MISEKKKETVKKKPSGTVTSNLIVVEEKRNVRLLLVEDDVINQKLALAILRKFGYSVDVVGNGLEALKALATIPYDLVLMDCQMPEMDGYEATEQIRSLKSKVFDHEIPIIAMTAHAMQDDRERCFKAGMNGYVSKPINHQELIDTIESHIDLSSISQLNEITGESYGNDDIFDKAALIERLMGDEDIAKQIIEGFIEDIHSQIDVLKMALRNCDLSIAQRQAHTIKGAAGNIGANALRGASYEIEVVCESQSLNKAVSLCENLDIQFERLKSVLNRSEYTKEKKPLVCRHTD